MFHRFTCVDLNFWGWFWLVVVAFFVWFVFGFFVWLFCLVCFPHEWDLLISFELCANSMQSWTTVGAVMARTAWEKKKAQSHSEFLPSKTTYLSAEKHATQWKVKLSKKVKFAPDLEINIFSVQLEQLRCRGVWENTKEELSINRSCPCKCDRQAEKSF